MTVATLSDVLGPALEQGYAVAGLVVLGWEDARAYARAGERESLPVILQAGPSCRRHTPLPVLGTMFGMLAESSSAPIVAHLDHGSSVEECREAIECGFTSVMYDGSRLPLEENIRITSEVVSLAHSEGASCEGEIGFVGYSSGEPSAATRPEDAARFAEETGVDAVAVSVGNVHLDSTRSSAIDMDALRAIESVTDVPLVLHGGSGIPEARRVEIARETAVCKMNIGTELRMEFGDILRRTLERNPRQFDRVEILGAIEEPLTVYTRRLVQSLAAGSRGHAA